jgi:DNA invertase Pin-like site-specific DNA recombinase
MGVQSISKKKGLGVEASSGVIDAVIYGRASKDRLRLMRSIEDQVADCRAWCEPLGWRVVDVITDANRSASQWRRKEREGFEEALGLIESRQIQGFVTWEPSRAGRDLAIYVQLRAACQRAGVLYLTQGRVYDFSRPDDSFMMGFEFLRAEADANTMRERQLRTARRNAEKGRPHGRLAYGYRRVYDERTGVLVRQEPDPHTGQIVRDAARDVLAGASMWSVAMRLQDAGEPTPMRTWSEHPRGWDTYTIRQLLHNPTIAGKRVYRGQVIGDAAWEPLIGWEDFQKLQRVFADPGRKVRGGGGMPAKTLMVHIARCHYCGRPLKRAVLRRKNKADAVKYHCHFRGCFKTTISQPGLDAYVQEVALAWFEQPANVARLTATDGDGAGAGWLDHAHAVEEELASLQQRLDEAADRYAAGELPLAMLSRIEQQLRPKIEQAQRALVPPISDENIRALVTAGDVRAAWAELALAEQRKIVKAVFDVRVQRTANRGQNAFEPARVLVAPRV